MTLSIWLALLLARSAYSQLATKTAASVVTVTGPIVDRYCWETNNGRSLDTKANLVKNPYNHTVFCLVEVDICRESGYVMLYQPENNSDWEVLYYLDDDLSEQLADEILEKVPVGSDGTRKSTLGYEATLTGIDDNNGYLRGGVVSVVGPLVDLYCWYQNDMKGLDNGVSLVRYPLQHTVHCMIDVSFCVASGYAILEKDDSTNTYDILYTLDMTLNQDAVAKLNATAATSAGYHTEVGYTYMAQGFDDGSGVLNSLENVVTVTGPLVDRLCWDDRGGRALDTNANLLTNPYNHTVFCLVEVEGCRESGYVIVNDSNGDGTWETLYYLDDNLNAEAIQQIYDNVPAAMRSAPGTGTFGFEVTLTGIDDGSGTLRSLEVTVTNATTEMPTTTEAGSGCESNDELTASGTLDHITVALTIDCEAETVQVSITNTEYNENWFGIVFSEIMIGTSLIYTTGNSANGEATRDLALYQYNNLAKAEAQVQWNESVEWTEVSTDIDGTTITIVYERAIAGAPIRIDQNIVNLRWAQSSGMSTSLAYHGVAGHSEDVLTLGFGSSPVVYSGLASTTTASTVTVEGPVVDRYCWETNNGRSLDTNANLVKNPYNHTVFCLVEVPQCRQSGYVMLHQPETDGDWEVLYYLDDHLNEKLIAEIYANVAVGSDGTRKSTLGYTATLTGLDDGSGYLRNGYVNASGPLVDLWCWNDNSMVALDTKVSLTQYPLNHTVHCMVDVDFCRESGFAILAKGNDSTYDILYTLDDDLNAQAVAELDATPSDSDGTHTQVGYRFATQGWDDNAGGLHAVPNVVTVSGPLVDRLCWDTRGGRALDTNANLLTNPYNHTVFCLVEVEGCRESGYVIVNDSNGDGTWEALYYLDDALNEVAIQQIYDNVPVGSDGTRKYQLGYRVTLTGIDDGNGTLLSLDQTEVITTTAAPETTAEGSGGCANAATLSATGSLDHFTIEITIDCVAQTITVNITNTDYNENWFGIPFSDTMIGTALVWTTGNSANNEETRELGLYQYNNLAKVASDVQYDESAAWTQVSSNIDGTTINIVYERAVSGSPVDIEVETVTLRWAEGSSTSLAYHGTSGHSDSTLTLNLLTGGSIVEEVDMTLQYVHGAIMWTTWAVLASFGIMSSAFRHLYPPGGKWFMFHRGVQVSVVLLTVIGFIIAVVMVQKNGGEHFSNPHMKMGLTVTILACWQPFNALFRAHPPSGGWPYGVTPVGRAVWEFIHKRGGYAAWILGCVTAFLGMQLLNATTLSYVHMFGWCGMLFVIYLVLSVTKCRDAVEKGEQEATNFMKKEEDVQYVMMQDTAK